MSETRVTDWGLWNLNRNVEQLRAEARSILQVRKFINLHESRLRHEKPSWHFSAWHDEATITFKPSSEMPAAKIARMWPECQIWRRKKHPYQAGHVDWRSDLDGVMLLIESAEKPGVPVLPLMPAVEGFSLVEEGEAA